MTLMTDGMYVLKDKIPIPCEDALEWARSMEKQRIVARTDIGCISISTVFLGLDHGFPMLGHVGEPILFETMIFDGSDDRYCERCSTWEQAEEQHAKAVRLVRLYHHEGYKEKPSKLWAAFRAGNL